MIEIEINNTCYLSVSSLMYNNNGIKHYWPESNNGTKAGKISSKAYGFFYNNFTEQKSNNQENSKPLKNYFN